ncbi:MULTISPECIES: hypothetical protein [unclassified Rathayibacter]|nr:MULTISPECIES: hypothetical protein [unclassified Rathayibacter]ROP44337.1 hypothetical protein EDF45_3802 [Rathayibacter sp. PhB186]ROQ52588.1 hypothetical protein EDF36_3749 [Rathayibacter sp. PhB152]ROS46849.1 hypothetical protein EDF44_3749 [Rathayibacter sp. PhB185]TCL83097.1 hypothetical protein EDF49_104150 [Rathayibacter sp. PhB192]TCM28595.1 hypothetical protein EDF43_104151 [Rathayibacter sp. PhB179]
MPQRTAPSEPRIAAALPVMLLDNSPRGSSSIDLGDSIELFFAGLSTTAR